MALGTNRLPPHPHPSDLEIELLDKLTQAGTPLFSRFGGIVFCGKIWGTRLFMPSLIPEKQKVQVVGS